MSGDYGIGSPNGAVGVSPKPRESAPDPQGANGASRDFSTAGVPTGQVNTRAGTHFESAVIPNPGFPATLRGGDQYAWYTIAWFEKYLERSPDADRLLLTNRWQRDAETGRIDPDRDANLFSSDLRSRIDVRRDDGSRALCEDLRGGCGLLSDDGSGRFSALDFAYGRVTPAPRAPDPLRLGDPPAPPARPVALEAPAQGQAAADHAHARDRPGQAPQGALGISIGAAASLPRLRLRRCLPLERGGRLLDLAGVGLDRRGNLRDLRRRLAEIALLTIASRTAGSVLTP